MKTRPLLIISLFLGLTNISFSQNKAAQISGYEVKKLPISKAIHELNKIITKEYPGRKDMLVAYVAPPFPLIRSNAASIDELEPRVTLKISKRIPITDAVQYIVDSSRCHFKVYSKQVVVYGWWQGVLERSE